MEQRLAGTELVITNSAEHGIPRLHLLEHEYTRVVVTAELEWLRGVCRAIAAGDLQ